MAARGNLAMQSLMSLIRSLNGFAVQASGTSLELLPVCEGVNVTPSGIVIVCTIRKPKGGVRRRYGRPPDVYRQS